MRNHLLLAIAATSCVSVFGQDTIGDRIGSANALIEQGHYSEAIARLTTIEQLDSAADLERGRVETLEGLAYSDLGELRRAEQLYEKALTTLGRNNRESVDYASALSLLARLRINAGDTESGVRLLRKAAQIDSRLQDHADLATVYLHLVAGAIGQKHWKAAGKYLDAAKTQVLLAGPNTEPLSAAVDGTAGWLDSVTGHNVEAAAAFKQALDIYKTLYGTRHQLTGWAYLLFGRSSAAKGDVTTALADMRTGMAILKSTIGTRNVLYLEGELGYAKVLEQAGMHREAEKVYAEASESLASLYHPECLNCTVSVWSLRNP
jgi:tetratricopeptide (TPR) repeat protein